MRGEPNGWQPGVEFDTETGTYRARFDAAAIRPSTAVVKTVAAVHGLDPLELPPLFEATDPDALDRQTAVANGDEGGGDVTIQFTYHGSSVTVESDGVIEVRPSTEEATGGPDRDP